MPTDVKYSVVIATYNRAADLRETLASLARLSTRDTWEVIVVDNNSTDGTADVVASYAPHFPAPLRYVFEAIQGRSAALNAGISAARGTIIATTDDDVRVEPEWLDLGGEALDRLECDYVGGRVLPIWGGPRPAWLSDRPGPHWAVIALLDYGPTPLAFTTRMPLGVNMFFRRSAFDRVGRWNPSIGRRAGTLLGQEVREWCIRARASGAIGYYVPELLVWHMIPAQRLNKTYFRRWFYWRGISRALLYQQHGLDMESPQETSVDFSRAVHIGGVPRYLYRAFLRNVAAYARAHLHRDAVASFERELWLWMFSGIIRQRWRDRHSSFEWAPSSPATGDARPAAHEPREEPLALGRR